MPLEKTIIRDIMLYIAMYLCYICILILQYDRHYEHVHFIHAVRVSIYCRSKIYNSKHQHVSVPY